MRATLWRQYGFEAAHFLPKVPDGHKCKRTHGHSYKIEVEIAGPVETELGWLRDFADIDAVVEPVIAALDHQLLNDIDGLDNPTSEILAAWLWRKLAPGLPGLSSLSVSETDRSKCTVRGE